MFVVFGVSGNTGRIVANRLLAEGKRVRVVVRDAKRGEEWSQRGAEVAVADVEESGSVERALAGAEGAYLLLPPDNRTPDFMGRARRVLDSVERALAAAHVGHVVFLSSVGAQHAAGTGPIKSLHLVEEELPKAAPGTRFTFIRAAYFMENILANLPAMKESGILPVFGGGESYPFPMVATEDIGAVAAEALLSPPSSAKQILELSGPADYSFADAARAFGAALGRTVTATPLPLEAMVPTLQQFGISADVAGQYREMTEGMAKGLLAWEGGAARRVRGTIGLDDFVKRVVGR
jgi:uncharacterized protein YbjT (DUF2867 family)